jgi:hypothetical protein
MSATICQMKSTLASPRSFGDRVIGTWPAGRALEDLLI